MSLTQQLLEKKEASKKYPAEKRKVMLESTQALIDADLSGQALGKGDKIPEFTLPDATGNSIAISDLLAKGKVVLSFYRGGWCPYCNLELRALQGILSDIQATGASLVAVSPQTPDHSLSTKEKNELAFPVLSDEENVVAKELGLVFQLPEPLQEVYDGFGLDLPKHNGNNDYELPMPATYIIDTDGSILYAFVPEDYTERLDPEDILKQLNH